MKKALAYFLLGFTIWIPSLLFVYETINVGVSGYFSIEDQVFWFWWDRAYEGHGYSINALILYYLLYAIIMGSIWGMFKLKTKNHDAGRAEQ